MKDSQNEPDLLSLVNMLEYIVPSHSLDLLTLIMIAAGNLEESNCALAIGSDQKSHAACKKVRNLEIFNLLK